MQLDVHDTNGPSLIVLAKKTCDIYQALQDASFNQHYQSNLISIKYNVQYNIIRYNKNNVCLLVMLIPIMLQYFVSVSSNIIEFPKRAPVVINTKSNLVIKKRLFKKLVYLKAGGEIQIIFV